MTNAQRLWRDVEAPLEARVVLFARVGLIARSIGAMGRPVA